MNKFFSFLFSGCDDGDGLQACCITTKHVLLTGPVVSLADVDKLSAYAKYCCKNGTNAYFRVTPISKAEAAQLAKGKRGKADMALKLCFLFADVDLTNAETDGHHSSNDYPKSLDEVLTILKEGKVPEPSVIVSSGGGAHLYWKLSNPIVIDTGAFPAANNFSHSFGNYLRSIFSQHDYGLDTVFDLDRLLRIPDTKNFKTQPPKDVTIASFNEGNVYDRAIFDALVASTRKAKTRQHSEAEKAEIIAECSSVQLDDSELAQVVNKCGVLKHLVDTVATQTEPQWWETVQLLVNLGASDEYIHGLSSKYPDYDEAECTTKIKAARDKRYIITCKHLESDFPGYCDCNTCCVTPVDLLSSGDAQGVQIVDRYKTDERPQSFGTYVMEEKNDQRNWKKVSSVVLKPVPDYVYVQPKGKNEHRSINFSANIKGKTASMQLTSSDFSDDKKFNAAIVDSLGKLGFTSHRNVPMLREALLSFSAAEPVKDVTVRTSIGWNADATKYLSTNGYIDKDGFHTYSTTDTEIAVIDPNDKLLSAYKLAPPLEGKELAQAKKFICDNLLQCFPYSVTLPAIAFVFGSVLRRFTPSIGFSGAILYGQTGSLKTAFARVLMGFFGDFSRVSLTSFTSTKTGIEVKGSAIEDAPFVLDDYKPDNMGTHDLIKLIQNYADRTGRQRSNVNLEARPEMVIKGSLLMTGEMLPDVGETSVLARLLPISIPTSDPNEEPEVYKLTDDIECVDIKGCDKEKLSAVQGSLELLQGVFAAFIVWLINDNNLALLDKIVDTERASIQAQHPRFAETVAFLNMAWSFVHMFFNLSDILNLQYNDAITAILLSQNSQFSSSLYSQRFIDALLSSLALGHCKLDQRNEFKAEELYRDGIEGWLGQDRPMVPRIGFLDDRYIYVNFSSAMAIINTELERAGQPPISVTPSALYRQLEQAGYLDPYSSKAKAYKLNGCNFMRLKRSVLLQQVDDSNKSPFLDMVLQGQAAKQTQVDTKPSLSV